jgi:5-methylcytosine-specific restriction endonuclease McrA
MIRRIADSVQISCYCEQVGSRFAYSIKIAYGRKALRTANREIPTNVDSIQRLLQGWIDEMGTLDELRRKSHVAVLGPYVPGQGQSYAEVRLRRTKELDDQHFAALRELEARAQRARESLERVLESIPIESPLVMTCDGRYYALHAGSLWTSTRRLTAEQWVGLISQSVNREDARLASATGSGGEPHSGRAPIPSHVRIEMWRRDAGRCVRCGSRGRLEFDHIIPIAHGGGGTARNIELLCETCNRAKSASIT